MAGYSWGCLSLLQQLHCSSRRLSATFLPRAAGLRLLAHSMTQHYLFYSNRHDPPGHGYVLDFATGLVPGLFALVPRWSWGRWTRENLSVPRSESPKVADSNSIRVAGR